MSTRASADAPEIHAVYRQVRDTWRDHGPVDPIVHGNANGILGPEAEVGELWKDWLPRWRAYDPKAIAAGIDAMVERDDVAGRLGEIEAPALVIHGTADVGVPFEHGEFLAKHLPGAKGLVALEGGHHSVVLSRAAEVIPPLRAFLEAHGK